MSRNHFQLVEKKEGSEDEAEGREGTDGVRETLGQMELAEEREPICCLLCPSPYVTVKESADRPALR